MSTQVSGYCPMGCGQTLFVGDGGHITCSYINCESPAAVDEILSEDETEHIVELYRETFSVKHPLRERLDDALLTCDLGEYLKGLDGPPRITGTYRVHRDFASGEWVFAEAQR